MDPARQLVIGIGNPLRGDDGVGWRLVEELTEELERQPATIATECRTLHQLTPELAPELAACDRVLFIDAWLAPEATHGEDERTPRDGLPRLRRLAIDTAAEAAFSHQLDPGQLLGMAHVLFGGCPRSDALLVPAFAFGHGTAFSDRLRHQLPTARRLLRHWLEGHHA